MRGEETQIAGYLNDKPNFTGMLCLPGTHSKWVHIKKGKITDFQTVLTGELFDLLTTQSVLKCSISQWDDEIFADAVKHSFSTPENMMTSLFSIRASYLLKGESLGKSKLSGILIGAELAALKARWETEKTIIIGAGELARLYCVALSLVGGTPVAEDVIMMTLSGMKNVYKDLFQ